MDAIRKKMQSLKSETDGKFLMEFFFVGCLAKAFKYLKY